MLEGVGLYRMTPYYKDYVLDKSTEGGVTIAAMDQPIIYFSSDNRLMIIYNWSSWLEY